MVLENVESMLNFLKSTIISLNPFDNTNNRHCFSLVLGFYRVNYDTATWENISKALKTNTYSDIHVLNRAQIVDDSLNLARGELLDYKLALSLLQYLEGETSYLPWLAAFNNLIYVERRFTSAESDVYRVSRKFVLI